MTSLFRACVPCGVLAAGSGQAYAADETPPPQSEVVVVAPYGADVDRSLVPADVQRANAQDIRRMQPLDLAELLNRSFGSVNINHAQNNPMQPDVNFRGFTASPLLGLPIGLSVFQNGTRINEPFGDTVSWDLIAASAIEEVQMIAGTSPAFGLNSLGGALSVRMKNGFSFQGSDAQLDGGSFSRHGAVVESGGHNGRFGYYGNVDHFDEQGWRDYSASHATRAYGALSYRGEGTNLDLGLSHADSKLRGNGSSPAELLAIDRSAVFTHPDITRNQLTQAILEGSRALAAFVRLDGNAFYRRIRTRTFNGDGTIFEGCEYGSEELLVEEDFDDRNGDGECSQADDSGIQLVRDPNGDPIAAELDGEELNAVNNIGARRQTAFGLSGQLTLRAESLLRGNLLSLGAGWSRGDTDFDSSVEVAQLLPNRATSRTGLFADEFRTAADSSVNTASVYLVDTQRLSNRVAMTLAARYDDIRIELVDQSGQSPALDGTHSYSRLNPAAGFTVQLGRGASFYTSYGESARAPSPVELACASEDAPCNLPNAFLADPPLDQVVARSAELGLRGARAEGLQWSVGTFHTLNRNDILFQATGGPQANVGFFDNVADTLRAGFELRVAQRRERVSWFFDYSYVRATFEEAFFVSSPNHPLLEEEDDGGLIAGAGKLRVASGATIPGIPRHQANAGADLRCGDRFSVGADVNFRTGVYLRGDEANLLSRTTAFAVVNLHGQYVLGARATVYARIENLFDREYETFGILGEPEEVFAQFGNPRFLGAGPPFGAWLGVRVSLR